MQPGDVVKLKSGSAAMTVEQHWNEEDDTWKCVWWSPDAEKFDSAVFPTAVLEPHKPKP